MHFKAHYPQPELLCEQPIGALLICHLPEFASCVLMHAHQGESNPAPLQPDALYPVVVLGCRVGSSEPGYVAPGGLFHITGAAPVTRMRHCGSIELRAVPKTALSEVDRAVMRALIG
jgi:hypothetical protein